MRGFLFCPGGGDKGDFALPDVSSGGGGGMLTPEID